MAMMCLPAEMPPQEPKSGWATSTAPARTNCESRSACARSRRLRWAIESIWRISTYRRCLRYDGFFVQRRSYCSSARPRRSASRGIGVVDIHHERDGLALDCTPDLLHAGDVVGYAVAELHFHDREARLEMADRFLAQPLRLALPGDSIEAGCIGLHPRAKGAAQQTIDGNFVYLPAMSTGRIIADPRDASPFRRSRESCVMRGHSTLCRAGRRRARGRRALSMTVAGSHGSQGWANACPA